MFHLRLPAIFQTTDFNTPPTGCEPRIPHVGEVSYTDKEWCLAAAPTVAS